MVQVISLFDFNCSHCAFVYLYLFFFVCICVCLGCLNVCMSCDRCEDAPQRRCLFICVFVCLFDYTVFLIVNLQCLFVCRYICVCLGF